MLDIVLEFVEGGHLGSFIRHTNDGQGLGRQAPSLPHYITNMHLGDRLSCHVTYQLCKAVAFIHKHNITHRDLKPEVCATVPYLFRVYSQQSQNILLTPDKPPIVKIADFGLAKLVDDVTALRVCT